MKGSLKSVLFIIGVRSCHSLPLAMLVGFHLFTCAQTWVPEANFPAGGRQYCSYFSIGSMGYIGFGNNNQVNDFWAYNPANNQWAQMASIPEAGGRAEMIQFVIGDKGYVGMGFNASGESNEFWQYDPSADTWTPVAAFPGTWSRGSFTFTINGKGYVGSGVAFINGNVDYSQLYEYDPVANTWAQKNAIPMGAQRYFGVGFSMGNYGYAGTGVIGSTAQQDFWQYDPVADSWTQKTDVPGGVRVNGINFQTATNGFIGMGGSNTGIVYNDVWEYNAGSNSWTQEPNYSGAGRLAGAGFAIGCDIYIGVGFNSSGTDEDDFWGLSLSSGASIGVTADTAICSGKSVILTATGGSSYTWGPDTALSGTTGATVTATPSSSITYTVTSSTGGCGGSASVTITVNQPDTAKVTISTNPPGPVCPGTAVSYTATPVNGGTPFYQWQKNGKDTGSNSPVFNLSLPDSGDIINCIMTSSAGCVTGSPAISNSIITSVITKPVAGNISANPATICSGDSSQLTNSGSTGSIQWQYSPDGVNFYNTTDSSSTYKTPALNQSAYYRVTSGSSCGADTSATIKLPVDVAAIPVLSTNDSLICPSDSTLIISSGSYVSYLWNNGDTRSYTYANAAGGYWLTVTDVNGCTATSSNSGRVNIRVYPTPSVSIIREGDTLSSYGAASYQWVFNDTNITGATSPLYVAEQTGSYALQITDTNGCAAVSAPLYVLISGIHDIVVAGVLNIYPNPTHGYIFIKANDNGVHIHGIEIMDLLSRTIMQAETTDLSLSDGRVDISALPAGMYYIKIETGNNEYLQKLIKQ